MQRAALTAAKEVPLRGLDLAHPRLEQGWRGAKAWMAGTSPATGRVGGGNLAVPYRVCRDVRADDRGPNPARGYRADHRSGGRPHDLRRGGQVRRRQGDPRRHGAVAAEPGRGRRRYGHHQCRHPRPSGHRQGRYRAKGGPHRRDRQGRQSRHPAGRRHRHRPGHRDHRRRGQDRHGRRHRQRIST